MKGKLIGWTAAGVAGVGIFAGVANAANSSDPGGTSSSPAPSTQQASDGAPGPGHRAQLEHRAIAGAVRGEVVLDNKKGEQTVDFQRGTASAASATSVTVTDKTGTAQTWVVSSTTKIRERGVSSPTLSNGETVCIIGSKENGSLTARTIIIRPAKSAPPAGGQAPGGQAPGGQPTL